MTETALSPFAQAAPDLQALGYSVLSVIPPSAANFEARGKMPGIFQGGHWQGNPGWNKLRDAPLSGFGLSMAMKYPGANIGIVCGTPAGRDGDEQLFVCALDLDMTDPDAVDEVVRALPASPMSKTGSKGLTLFFRASKAVTSRTYDDERIPRGSGVPRRLADLLTGFAPRQTISPPSAHPDGPVYRWIKGPVAAHDLPILTPADVDVLGEVLQAYGYQPAEARGGKGERKPFTPSESGGSDDPFEQIKADALANLSLWVPHVDNLFGLRPARRGYEAVNLLRDSSSGRATSERKRNLSINPQGITDFGTGETWSAIDLVSDFNGLSVSEAVTWLEDRLYPSDVVIDLDEMRAAASARSTTPTALDAAGGAGAVFTGGGAVDETTTAEVQHTPAPNTTHGRVVRTLDLSQWGSSRLVGMPPETEWLVRDVLPAAIPGMVAAQGDAGKSLLLLELARRIAFNASPLEGPCFGGMVEQEGTCVFVTAEDDAPAVHRRVANLDPQNARFSQKNERLFVVPLPDAGGPMPLVTAGRRGLEATDAYKRLADTLSAIPDLRLVVFDPLQAFVLAPINEDPAAGQFVCSMMATLAAETHSTVLLAHHMRKADRKTPVKTLQDIRDLVRGTSALVDGLRWVYGLVPEEDAAAREACKRLGVEWVPNRVIKGGVVKANGPVRRRMSTYIRNDVGLLVDQTAHLNEMPTEKQELAAALVLAVAFAAKTGAPFTRMGQTGFEQQKHRLPPVLQEMGRDRLIRLADDALARGLIVGTLAKGSTTAKWLDVPGGPFATGEGEFALGATRTEAA